MIGDGNCLYTSLSHIIFGTETLYNQEKQNMISKLRDCPEHILNVMNILAITCEQDLEENLDHLP